MNLLVVICLFSQALCKGFDMRVGINSLSLALENVTHHLFKLETRMFISNYGVDSEAMTWLLLKDLNERAMPYRLQSLDFGSEEILMDSSALLTFGSFDNVRAFNDKLVLTNEFYKPLQFFIYCQGATVNEIESLAGDVERKHENIEYLTEVDQSIFRVKNLRIKSELMDVIQYEYFMLDDVQFVKLLTFVWYSPEKCEKLQLIEINKFSKETLKWESDSFKTEKVADFHNCNVYGLVDPPSAIGLSISLIPDFMIQMNLNLRFQYRPSTEKQDIYFSRGCYNAVDRYRKIVGGDKGISYFEYYFITKPFEFVPIQMAVPPGELYTEYEKLRMPFDDYVWALIGFVFAVAFVTVFILYRMKRSKRNLIIGSNITAPSMNITQIFFGIPQVAMPRRSFARFLAMSFIVYSLIIRTAWQGKMYEFMQKNISKPELETVEELIEAGYTFYVLEQNYRAKFPESEISKRAKVETIEFNKVVQEANLPFKILDPKFKGVVLASRWTTLIFNIISKGRYLGRLRSEELYVEMCGLRLPPHHHFFEIMELKMQQLTEGHIFKHALEPDFFGINKYNHLYVSHPKVLTMAMLEPGFVIWTSSLFLAIVAFLLEWLMTLRDYLVVKFLLIAFYETNYDRVGISELAGSETPDDGADITINIPGSPDDSQELQNYDEIMCDRTFTEISELETKSRAVRQPPSMRRDSIDHLIELFEK